MVVLIGGASTHVETAPSARVQQAKGQENRSLHVFFYILYFVRPSSCVTPVELTLVGVFPKCNVRDVWAAREAPELSSWGMGGGVGCR